MTERLLMPAALADEMIAHCRSEFPKEACGILAADDGNIVKVFKMSNADASPVRFRLDPQEQLRMYNLLDEEGWQLGALYHSHTRTEAYPSPTDIKEAREVVPYLIVSLAVEPPAIKAFMIHKEPWDAPTGEVVEVSVVVER